jgi:hypothetical protein
MDGGVLAIGGIGGTVKDIGDALTSDHDAIVSTANGLARAGMTIGMKAEAARLMLG